MFHFTSKLLRNYKIIESKAFYFRCIQTLNSASNSQNQQSLTVNYLTNSCGLSLQRAVLASKYVNIVKTEKSDLVLRFFKAYGLTKANITRLISVCPPVILSDPQKTIKPKLDFFESLGFIRADIHKIICYNPKILTTRVQNSTLPTIDYLKGFLETHDRVIFVLKKYPRILGKLSMDFMVSNMDTLRGHGVPEPRIKMLLMLEPRVLTINVDMFKEVIEHVKEMGFEPEEKLFIYAFRSKSIMSKSKWESKREVLTSYGWSESDFLSAFRTQPMFILSSDKKMKLILEFFSKKLYLDPSDLVKRPNVFLLSLERNIIPRCSALELLMSKGLIRKDLDFASLLNLNKTTFEKSYITCFEQDFPELIDAYQGKGHNSKILLNNR